MDASRHGGGRRYRSDSRDDYYVEPTPKPETPMQLLKRNISVGIERGKTKKLSVGGLRIYVQKAFEDSLLPPSKDFRKPKPNPFISQPKQIINLNAGSSVDASTDHISRRDLFRGTRPVPLLQLPEFQQRRATQVQRRRHRQPSQYQYHGMPMSREAYMARRRSIQFQIRPTQGRSAAAADPNFSRNSVDSLKTVLGSVQEQNTRRSIAKSNRRSQLLQQEELPPPPTADENEDEEETEEIAEDDGQEKSGGKIRFDIPAGDREPKDPNVKQKIRDRRPTSVRTTRFTVPDVSDEDRDANKGVKIKARRQTSGTTTIKTPKTPRFDILPAKLLRDKKASEKIRERRPTPMLKISPMFAYLPQVGGHENKEDKHVRSPYAKQNQQRQGFPLLAGRGESGLYLKGMAPEVGIFPSVFRGRISQKIQQRSKTPEPNEVAQELKKVAPIPTKVHRHHPPSGTPSAAQQTTGDVTAASSRADLNALTPLENNMDDDPGTGLMRIRKRRNIGGRVLTPPFSRNERSNSMTVLDFRSSIFYKRAKSTLSARPSDKDARRELLGMVNKQSINNAGREDTFKGADKVRFD